MNKDYFAALFRRTLKRAGVGPYRVYDMRHTFASLLLAENAPITYVAMQLGHSNPATTLRYYARWIGTPGKRWVTLLDRRHRGTASSELQTHLVLEPGDGTAPDTRPETA